MTPQLPGEGHEIGVGPAGGGGGGGGGGGVWVTVAVAVTDAVTVTVVTGGSVVVAATTPQHEHADEYRTAPLHADA